jgi:hypothetical protein
MAIDNADLRMEPTLPNRMNSAAPRVLGGIFGLVFFGIGLTVLGFLWLSTGPESPPLVFRMFGSFIAIGFVAMGGFLAAGAVLGRMSPAARLAKFQPSLNAIPASAAPGSYVCPHCAAPLQPKTEVSPSGDVKCPFCNSWFNIHRAGK